MLFEDSNRGNEAKSLQWDSNPRLPGYTIIYDTLLISFRPLLLHMPSGLGRLIRTAPQVRLLGAVPDSCQIGRVPPVDPEQII